jgi:Rrf2 family protein
MVTSSRVAVGIHILTLLALHEGEVLTSDFMATSVNTNPVVIRRLLGALQQHGLVAGQAATGGGWRLVRRPAEITLLDVYQAVEEGELFALHHRPPNPACTVGRHIQGALEHAFTDAQAALEERLAHRTIADMLATVLTRATTTVG